MQILERLNVFLKIYDNLVFLDFLYLLQTLQYISTYLEFIENILLFCHFLYSLGENKFVYSKKLLHFNIK